jgi:uncharacterized protein involved in exopolysaccharide biosynthesis
VKPKLMKIGGVLGLALGLGLTLAGMWTLTRTPLYRASARIGIKIELWDGLAQTYGNTPFDSYFIPTDFEIMQSDVALGRVVDEMDLTNRWAAHLGNGTPLEKHIEAIALLKRRADFRLIRNTHLTEISVMDEDPSEAVAIVNTIATVYDDHKKSQIMQGISREIQSLDQSQQERVRQIQTAQALMDSVKKVLQIPESMPEQVLRTNYPDYYRAEEQFGILEWYQNATSLKIDALKSESVPDLVEFASSATPPQKPISPNRPLGMAELLSGLLCMVFGWRWAC